MSTTATPSAPAELRSCDRLEVLFDEMAELVGRRNATDARITEIVAEIDRDGIWGSTGARSMTALVAWKTGVSDRNAEKVLTVARRLTVFPRLAAALAEGRISLDQVEVIAARAADGSDDHYAPLAEVATVNQLRTAVKQEPPPPPPPPPAADADIDGGGEDPEPAPPCPEPPRSITSVVHDDHTVWTIRLPRLEAAKFDAGLQSHRDALIAQWRRDHPDHDPGAAETDDQDRAAHAGWTRYGPDGQVVPETLPDHGPFPTTMDAFLHLMDAGWDADVAQRPHGQRTTVVVHLDVERSAAALHMGPLLSDAERQFLTCDATCEVWFERQGRPIGAGRNTRTINRRLRRALEHRDRCCAVPGCGATRGLHAHHIKHWEDGGETELENLVLLCPYHHRLHHSGGITIGGDAYRLVVTDQRGRELSSRSLARPPTQPPPDVAPCRGPLGERADWWWYTPYQPPPPTPN